MNKCHRCGACCRHLLIECGPVDALREPKLLGNPPNRHHLTVEDLADGEKVIIIYGCPFLGEGNCCEIYPTRPWECVAFEPDSQRCQEAHSDDAKARAALALAKNSTIPLTQPAGGLE